MRCLPWMAIVAVSLAPLVAGAQSEEANKYERSTYKRGHVALMMSFAERTGLTSERPRQRYLWTDALAVCNFLGLTAGDR